MLVSTANAYAAIRQQIVGLDTSVPLLDGRAGPAINLDNAATTPALRPALDAVERLLAVYGSVHRGAGFKSQLTSSAVDQARQIVERFVGADPQQHIVIFTRNTTEALNLLAHRLDLQPDDLVITTELEHHANDLPWRAMARTLRVGCDAQGNLLESELIELLRGHAGRVKLVTLTGGSNVTGAAPDVHRLAELAHAHGAQIAVDAAQLAAHRPIDMGALDDPAHLDYVALSGHKLYAPFGAGALIGRRDTFEHGEPLLAGGGAVRRITAQTIEWAAAPAREEAGTPNAVGIVALAAALGALDAFGLQQIAEREAELTAYTLERLRTIPRLRVFGDADPERAHARLGVIPFAIDGYDPHLVAAILGYEHGIAVRSGSFCAQPYVARLIEADAGCDAGTAGLVRLSPGIYTTPDEIDRLTAALAALVRGQHAAYARTHGEYQPEQRSAPQPELFSYALAAGSRLALTPAAAAATPLPCSRTGEG